MTSDWAMLSRYLFVQMIWFSYSKFTLAYLFHPTVFMALS